MPLSTNTNTNGNVYYSNVHYIFHIFSAVEHNQNLDLQILLLYIWRYTNGTMTEQIG